MKRKQMPWMLAKLWGTCPTALAVWVVLCEMAAERRSSVVTPTRAELCKRIGIARLKTISKALTALEKAHWIDRDHKPVFESGNRTATLLRLVVRRMGRSAPSTGRAAVKGAQRPKGKGRSAPRNSLLRKEGASPGTATPVPVTAPDHFARLEQEKLAAIRETRKCRQEKVKCQ